MIVEFYWLYLNRLLLPQQYCAATIKLFWHITLNISAWTCQLCTSGATAQCQELLVTLRSLFTIRQTETTVSEPSCLRCYPVPCHPPGCGQLVQGSSEGFSASSWERERFGEQELSFPWFQGGCHSRAPQGLLQPAEDKCWEKGRTMKLSKQMSRLGLGNF